MGTVTEKQVGFITRLLLERVVTNHDLQLAQVTNLSRAEASKMIDTLLTFPKKQVEPKVDLQPGMYLVPGNGTAQAAIYKVQRAKKSGNLYAKRLTVFTGQRLTEENNVVNFEFQYEAGSIKQLTAAMRMTLEQAKSFGIKYGVCCVCGAFLKDAESVAAGIGPVCAGRV